MDILKSTEFKVGSLVLTVIVLIAVMSMQVSEDPSYMGHSNEYWFQIKDASGLLKNSQVKMAGINVGVIKDIRLKNGKALIELGLDNEVPVTANTRIEVRANGILGDKYIEIVTDDPESNKLSPGARITNIQDSGSVAALMNDIGKLTQSLTIVADRLKDAATGTGNQEAPISQIVNNLNNFTRDLADLTRNNNRKLDSTIDSLDKITGTLNDLVNDESEDGLRVAWYKATKAMDRLDGTMKNFEDISTRVNSGEGTLGKLINDDETIVELNSAIKSVNEFVGTSSTMMTTVDFHTEYLDRPASAKSYLGLQIQPGLDRYYELQVVDDPAGLIETTETSTTTGGSTTVEEKTETFKDRVKFTALYAKKFFNFTIKGGLIENTGGFGMDYYLYKNTLKWSFEAFDFGDLNIRTSLRWTPMRGFYVMGGGSDLASKEGESTAYVGAGIFLTNDDLKLIFTGLSLGN